MDNLNELEGELHQVALSKGWYDTERTFPELIALIHSELSEALEEYRNDKPMVYYYGKFGDIELDDNGTKPEGIAIELVDTAIRILDACAYMGYELDSEITPSRIPDTRLSFKEFPEFLTELHYKLSIAYRYQSYGKHDNTVHRQFSEILASISHWLGYHRLDMVELIKLKSEYNRKREHRHGGKRG